MNYKVELTNSRLVEIFKNSTEDKLFNVLANCIVDYASTIHKDIEFINAFKKDINSEDNDERVMIQTAIFESATRIASTAPFLAHIKKQLNMTGEDICGLEEAQEEAEKLINAFIKKGDGKRIHLDQSDDKSEN